jgi:pilus assembly protein Flp/PilA
MKQRLMKYFRNEDGATAVEYAIMVALIAAVIIGTVWAIGQNTNNTFNTVAGALATMPTGS